MDLPNKHTACTFITAGTRDLEPGKIQRGGGFTVAQNCHLRVLRNVVSVCGTKLQKILNIRIVCGLMTQWRSIVLDLVTFIFSKLLTS